jgi:hypothetical protein
MLGYVNVAEEWIERTVTGLIDNDDCERKRVYSQSGTTINDDL